MGILSSKESTWRDNYTPSARSRSGPEVVEIKVNEMTFSVTDVWKKTAHDLEDPSDWLAAWKICQGLRHPEVTAVFDGIVYLMVGPPERYLSQTKWGKKSDRHQRPFRTVYKVMQKEGNK